MQAAPNYVFAIVMAAMMALVSSGYAQDETLKVPKVIVIAQAAPVVPPYMRDPWKAYA